MENMENSLNWFCLTGRAGLTSAKCSAERRMYVGMYECMYVCTVCKQGKAGGVLCLYLKVFMKPLLSLLSCYMYVCMYVYLDE